MLAIRLNCSYSIPMRLFYALEFDSATKEAIALLQQDVLSYCPKGFYTRFINLHLTLCFLGEVEGQSLPMLKEILLSLESPPLLLKFNQLGLFRKRQGDILWLGIEDNTGLAALQKELAHKLHDYNVSFEDQIFHPHVTLARGTKCKKLPSIEILEVVSDKISLMHSHQTQDILTYTPLITKQL